LRLDPELRGVDPELARGLAGETGCLLGVGDLGEEQGDAGVGSGPPSFGAEVLLFEGPRHDEGENTPGLGEARAKGVRALGAQQGIGVVAGGKDRHLDREVAGALEAAGLRDRPAEIAQGHHLLHHLLGARRRLAAGRVVETVTTSSAWR
jgi:hypothetical protein